MLFPEIYAQLDKVGGIVLYMKLIWCNGFPDIYAQLEKEEGGGNLPWVYVYCTIYKTSLVEWFSRDLCLIGGEGGVNVPWVCVHCDIYI